MGADLDVLIVDDHEAMRTMLRTVLERAGGVSVRTAANGAEALTLVAQDAPQLILVDRRMPEMDGLAFVARVRADARCAGTRIIMISGQADAAAREAAADAGADLLLAKPVSPRDLIAAIAALFA